MKPVWIASLAALALVGAYIAAGGLSYAPADVADPCAEKQWSEPGDLDELGQQLALSGLDGAACELGVTRESLARALTSDSAREDLMEEHGIDEEELESGARAGIQRMVDDAEEAGEIGSFTALGLRGLARVIPAREAFELLLDARPLIERMLGGSDLEGDDSGDGDGGEEGDEAFGLDDLSLESVDDFLDSLSTPSE